MYHILIDRFIIWRRRRICIIRRILLLCFPIIIVLDILRCTLVTLRRLSYGIIGYIAWIIRRAGISIKNYAYRLLMISDRYLLVISFRIAVIVSIISFVVINRIELVFRCYEKSTAICEFVASIIHEKWQYV